MCVLLNVWNEKNEYMKNTFSWCNKPPVQLKWKKCIMHLSGWPFQHLPKSFLHAKTLWRARWFSPVVHEPLNFKRLRWCHGWQSCIWHGIERPVWYLDHIHSWWHRPGPLGQRRMPDDDLQGHMKNCPMPIKCQIEEIVLFVHKCKIFREI